MFRTLSCLSGPFRISRTGSLGSFKKSVPLGLTSAMAAQLLEDLMTCSICLSRYRDPVTLPCGHSFCRDCIQDSWRCWEKTCPECRQPFPEDAKLSRNVTLSTLLQTLPCELPPPPAATPLPELGAGHSASCPRHGRPLEFFCRTHGLCVCSACTVYECRHHERALLDVERRLREDQLRARVAVTRQQVTQAETQLQELQQQSSQIESSACTLTSVVSRRFSSLLQALEKLQASTLRDIEVAKKQALGQALSEIQRLTGHLEVLSQYDHSVQDLLGQVDDCIFFQELQQLSEPVESLRPLTIPQWDEEQQLHSMTEVLGPLCELLLEEKPPGAADKASLPVEALGPPPPVPSTVCPLRKKLWQNYRNLTFDPDTANQYLYLSHEDQQVTHHFQAQGPARPGSFELWQVQCTQSFETGRHYWEAEQPKVLSAVEDRMDELGASIAQSRRTVALIKSAALAERERVSQMFAEATATLQSFQTEVLGFIEEGEATMLGRSQGDLRRQEEQRSRLSRARHNLSQVPEADSVSFLQELLVLRLALEEGCGPGPGPPRELGFTKSSQVVRALRDILVSTCASQWEQLRGLNSEEDELQKHGSEADVESQDPDSTNLLESEAPRDYFLKFAYIVDLDSDTADKFLQLFGTKGVKRVLCPINYPESPTRFTHCEQVLGEGALDRGTYYWEVEIIEGWVSVGVMAEGFSPQEPYDRGRLGRNAHSCCLQWNGRGFSVWFCGLEAPLPHAFSPTVGVCLEYADHALAFYAVRDGKLSLLRRLKASRPRRSGALASPTDPFQSRLDSYFSGLFSHRLKPAFFLESVDAHLQIGPLKKSCISVLKR
ncbi:hypothetical protein STEG23_019977, partial [Scotinomys teguina]